VAAALDGAVSGVPVEVVVDAVGGERDGVDASSPEGDRESTIATLPVSSAVIAKISCVL